MKMNPNPNPKMTSKMPPNRRNAVSAVSVVLPLCLCLLCCALVFPASGQSIGGKHRLAVFVPDAEGGSNLAQQGMVIAMVLTNALSEDGPFAAMSRSSEFVAAIERERVYRRPGSGVDDVQLARVGKRLGFSHVCAVSSVPLYYAVQGDIAHTLLSAMIIETASGTVVGAACRIAALRDDAALLATSQSLAQGVIEDFYKRGAAVVGPVSGQVAVFLADEEDAGVGRLLTPLLITGAIEYGLSERTNTLLEMLPANRRRSELIGVEQLAKLGAKSGAKFVMAVKVVSKVASVKIIDAASGIVVKSQTVVVDASGAVGIERSAKELAVEVFKPNPAPPPPPPIPPEREAPPTVTVPWAEVDWGQPDVMEVPAAPPPAERRLRTAPAGDPGGAPPVGIAERAAVVEPPLPAAEPAPAPPSGSDMEELGPLEKKIVERERLTQKRIRRVKVGINYNGPRLKKWDEITDKSNGAEIYDAGAAAVIYLGENAQIAPQANYRWGTRREEFAGFSFPLLLQFSTDYRRKAAFYAEGGGGLDWLSSVPTGGGERGPYAFNASVIAGIGVAIGRCVHLDIVRISLGTAYSSLSLGSVRVVF